MLNNIKFFVTLALLFLSSISLVSAQVQDTVLKKEATPVQKIAVPEEKVKSSKTDDTAKYVNPGKLAARKALFKSLIIPGWGQLYNNQILVQDYKAKGETTGHFWQKTYTLGKVGIIYTGFTLLTLSYIDNSKNYKVFLKEAQARQINANLDVADRVPQNPDLARYSNEGIVGAKDVYKRNRQVVIFSMAAVYLANVVDAYVAARLHYFNIDDNLAFNVSPTLIHAGNGMYGFNVAPALKFSLKL